ncbi:MAG: hypothetical protein JWO31_2795, partial [Phycisphaerales bacterium]|nr:hypothetical protein [Phycisphaerales bacterium]
HGQTRSLPMPPGGRRAYRRLRESGSVGTTMNLSHENLATSIETLSARIIAIRDSL